MWNARTTLETRKIHKMRAKIVIHKIDVTLLLEIQQKKKNRKDKNK